MTTKRADDFFKGSGRESWRGKELKELKELKEGWGENKD